MKILDKAKVFQMHATFSSTRGSGLGPQILPQLWLIPKAQTVKSKVGFEKAKFWGLALLCVRHQPQTVTPPNVIEQVGECMLWRRP